MTIQCRYLANDIKHDSSVLFKHYCAIISQNTRYGQRNMLWDRQNYRMHVWNQPNRCYICRNSKSICPNNVCIAIVLEIWNLCIEDGSIFSEECGHHVPNTQKTVKKKKKIVATYHKCWVRVWVRAKDTSSASGTASRLRMVGPSSKN